MGTGLVSSRTIGVIGVVAATIVAAALPLAAQAAHSAAPEPPTPAKPPTPESPAMVRQGSWFGAGLGAGAASLHCSICSGEQGSRGTSGYLRVGTTVNPFFLVGAELNGWTRSDQSGSQRVVALTGNAYWYPSPGHGYYVKGGFGLSRYRQSSQDDNQDVTNALTAGGFAGQVGAGYETRVNPRMSIVPYLNLIGSARGALAAERDDGTHFDRDRLSTRANVLLLQIGLGVTWH